MGVFMSCVAPSAFYLPSPTPFAFAYAFAFAGSSVEPNCSTEDNLWTVARQELLVEIHMLNELNRPRETESSLS